MDEHTLLWELHDLCSGERVRSLRLLHIWVFDGSVDGIVNDDHADPA